MPVGTTGPTEARLQLAARAAELRADGLLIREVGDELGISRSYVSELIRDPDGSLARRRKDSYSQPCPICGRPMTGSDGMNKVPTRCHRCAAEGQHDERIWTCEAIIESFWEFYRETGRVPTAADPHLAPSIAAKLTPERRAEIARNQTQLPNSGTVQREFGSWNNGIRAAGFEPNSVGQYKRPRHWDHVWKGQSVKPRPAQDAIIELLRDGPLSSGEIAAQLGKSHRAVRVVVTRLRARGKVHSEKEPGRREALYWLVDDSEESNMAREYVVLEETENGWVEHAGQGANPEMAVESVAKGAGRFVAIPSTMFIPVQVAKVTKLAVVRPEEVSPLTLAAEH